MKDARELLMEPDDYTWREFLKTFEIACTDAWEAYWEHPDPALSPNPTITLPHSVFPLVTAVVNPLTGDECPITRTSPFDWGEAAAMTEDDAIEFLNAIDADPLRQLLHTVWCSAVDAASSDDLRDGDGVLNEQLYLTYQRNVFDAAVAKLRPAAVYVVTEECGYDVGQVVRGVYATSEAAMRAHPGEWKPAGTSIDGEPDSWSAGLPNIDRYEVQT